MAVAVDRSFFETLPSIEEVGSHEAEMIWLVYDLEHDASLSRYKIVRHKAIYTRFNAALDKITRAEPGDMQKFIDHLQEKLDEKLVNGSSPDAPSLLDALEQGEA
jgi:hypothetical protein